MKQWRKFLTAVFMTAGALCADDKLTEEAKDALKEILTPVLSTWNADYLMSHLHYSTSKNTKRADIDQLFFNCKGFGPLVSFDVEIAKTDPVKVSVFKTVYIAEANIPAEFEKRKLNLYVKGIKDGARWYIFQFSIDSDNSGGEAAEAELPSREELEPQVEKMLQVDDVITDREVWKVFRLADLCVEDGEPEKAISLYERGLQAVPGYIYYQNQLMNLLFDAGRTNDAVDRLQFVFQYAEDTETITAASKRMTECGFPVLAPAPASLNTNVVIALVPVGKPDRVILYELQQRMQQTLGVEVRILHNAVPPGVPERSFLNRYISETYAVISTNLTTLQIEETKRKMGYFVGPVATVEQQRKFIETVLVESGNEQDLIMFKWYIGKLEQAGGQYNIANLSEAIRPHHPYNTQSNVKMYLGVTEQDLYGSEDGNFSFGGSSGAYGVISYYRMHSSITGEFPNRPRLVTRLLKQALSTTGFITVGARCSQPFCARAYPNSVAALDNKSDRYCAQCQAGFEEFKKGRWKAAVAFEHQTAVAPSHGPKLNSAQSADVLEQIMKTPMSAGACVNYGLEKIREGKRDDALYYFQKAIEINPQMGTAHENIGILYSQMNQRTKAMEHFLKAAEFKPDDPNSWNNLGYTCFLEKDFQQAMFYYNKALQCAPQNGLVHYNIALLHYEMQKYNEAWKSLQIAILNGYTGSPEFRKKLEEMKNIL